MTSDVSLPHSFWEIFQASDVCSKQGSSKNKGFRCYEGIGLDAFVDGMEVDALMKNGKACIIGVEVCDHKRWLFTCFFHNGNLLYTFVLYTQKFSLLRRQIHCSGEKLKSGGWVTTNQLVEHCCCLSQWTFVGVSHGKWTSPRLCFWHPC